MSAAAQNLLTNRRLHHLFQTHPNRPKPLFSNLPIRPCRKPYPLEIPSHYSPDRKLHSFKTSQWQIRVFQSGEGIKNRQIHKLNLDTFLSVAEVLCIAPSVVFSIGCALNSVISWAPQKSLQVSLVNRFFVWQFVFLAGAVVIGALIRQRQWQRICRDTVDYGGLNIIERIENLEEDLRSSATIVRVLSRQLEKLGIRFRVTRKSLKDPITEIRPDRQTLYWSATWPREVETLARQFLQNPYKVIIGSPDLKANQSIIQIVEVVQEHEKYPRLIKLLGELMDGSRMLVFLETKKGCDQVTRQLRMDGWPALSIHGDKNQAERDWVLAEFKSGRSPIMTATDVAARGLDVKDIKCVINYDFPASLEDYVHRIGRTGRAGAKGTAFTFFTHANARFAKDLIKILQGAGQSVSPTLSTLSRSGGGGTGGNFRSRGRGFGNRSSISGSNTTPLGGAKRQQW